MFEICAVGKAHKAAADGLMVWMDTLMKDFLNSLIKAAVRSFFCYCLGAFADFRHVFIFTFLVFKGFFYQRFGGKSFFFLRHPTVACAYVQRFKVPVVCDSVNPLTLSSVCHG